MEDLIPPPPVHNEGLGIPPINDDLGIPPIKEETWDAEPAKPEAPKAEIEKPIVEEKVETPKPEIKTSREWFSISNQGWKRMNAGRSMSFLIREGISNVLDLDNATTAKITIDKGHVIIEDDGETGFADPSLITTVFLTDKEDQPTKRGRKGRGLKELISAADKAIVETIGITVEFDQEGRKEYKNTRTKGTKVEVWSNLETWQDPKETIEYLRRIIPPEHLTIKINGKKVESPEKHRVLDNITLETQVIKGGVQQNEYRASRVILWKSKKESWLYEMGVPIQKIDTPWHIDIQQRVPLNDNRDTVNDYFKYHVCGKLMNYVIDELTLKDCQESWAINAMWYITEETKKKIAGKVTSGRKVVVKTANRKANDVAKTHGYELLDLENMASNLKDIVAAFVTDSEKIGEEIAKTTESEVKDIPEAHKRFAEVMCYLGEKVTGHKVVMSFYEREVDCGGMLQVATYQRAMEGDKAIGKLRWNIKSDETDFEKPLSEYALGVLTHELAHEWAADDHEHAFMVSLQNTAGKLSLAVFKHKDEIPYSTEQLVAPHKSTFITCVDCGAKREVKPQDVFQVKRCLDCQKKFRSKKKR